MKRWKRAALSLWMVCVVATSLTAETTPPRQSTKIRGPLAESSRFPTATFDEKGRLWLAFVDHDIVYVTSSGDLGRTFAVAVAVNREAEEIDANGEGRPKIAVTRDGTVLVSWTKKLKKPFTGAIRFSRSTDGGRTFETPSTINDDGLPIGHRFDALAVAPSGEIHVAWIDKRDLERASANGSPYSGAAIYIASSRDGGQTFEPNRKLKDNVCECCRLWFSFDAKGRPALLFRDVLDNGVRDHTLARGIHAPTVTRIDRVTFDDWKIDACPHHGPSLWIDRENAYHMTWFTAGERSGTGSFYARSTDGGDSFSKPLRLGTERAAHPVVLGLGESIYLSWKEADGTKETVFLRRSSDGGASFGPREPIAEGAPGADHPLLISDGREVFVSWFTRDAGYRLIAVTGPSASE